MEVSANQMEMLELSYNFATVASNSVDYRVSFCEKCKTSDC